MLGFERIERLVRTMRRLAAVVSVATAASLPLGYFVVSYSGESRFLQYNADYAAERLSEFAYQQGDTWTYAAERIGEILAETQSSHDRLHTVVTLPDGQVVDSYAPLPDWPPHGESAAIVVSGRPLAMVTTSASQKPLILKTVAVGLFGLLLGCGAFAALHMLPLRALDRALTELRTSLNTIEAHAQETDFAYEELKRQHRLVEETTQELMRARDQAMTADRTKSAFLATMSHELRTPLNAIIGFSEMLSQEVFGPLGNQRYRDYSTSICESGRHLLAVINDVLDISKVEAGKLQLHLEDVELGDLLDSSVRLVRAKVVEAGVELDVEAPAAPLPRLRADPVKVKQVILNLLSNALKFTPAGGRIAVSSGTEPGGGIYFRIADTGIGMNREEVAVALQPFRQVDNSHTRKYEGTGLGLPLAKALAEQHGGRLVVDSRPGEGTSVTVTLPLGEVGTPAIATGIEAALRTLKA